MRLSSAVVCWLLVPSSIAVAQTYTIDPAKSRISFSVPYLLGTTRGEFHRFSGTIVVNREQPERSSVTATIQVASIDTKIRRRDDHLLSADFFDASRFPTITFRSRSVRRTGRDTGDVTGDLTIKGTTRPITLHVTLLTPLADEHAPRRTRWRVTTDAIARKEFGLMFSNTAEAISGIGQKVTPSIEIEAAAADE